MTDLERLELIIRRIHAKRAIEHQKHGAMLDLGMQQFLDELADEIALAVKAR